MTGEVIELSTHVGRVTDRDDYETPNDLFSLVSRFYGLCVDCAASESTAKCQNYYSTERSFLTADPNEFLGAHCWLNPPFSMKEEFLAHVVSLRNDARIFVCLLPNNARETNWWTYIWLHADEIISLSPRVNYFLDGKPLKNGVPFSSCLAIFRPRFETQYGFPREIIWHWKPE